MLKPANLTLQGPQMRDIISPLTRGQESLPEHLQVFSALAFIVMDKSVLAFLQAFGSEYQFKTT